MNLGTQTQIIFAVVNDPSSNRYSDESKGQRTNPLIRFDPIIGLAVGIPIRNHGTKMAVDSYKSDKCKGHVSRSRA